MDKYLKEVENVIQKAAIDGTLTEKAIAEFHDTIGECEALMDKCVKLEQTQMRMEKENKEINAMLAQTSSKLGDYQTRERELVEREKKNQELSLEAKHQAARVQDHKDMVALIFRNTLLKKEVMTPQHDYTESTGAHHSNYETKQTLEEEEK